MAWSPLALRNTRLALARRLAARGLVERTAALLDNSASFIDKLRKSGSLPSPLLLALRAANKLAQTLTEQHAAPPTSAQRRALLAAASQIRVLAAGILATGSRDPNSVEYQLAELINRTLALIDQVTAEPLTIEATLVEDKPKLGE
jgi:hypothetical protein